MKMRNSIWKDGVFLVATIVLLSIVFLAIFSPVIAPYSPNKMDVRNRLLPPVFVKGGSIKHILGTDQLGRDLFTRIMYGLRNSLLIAFFSVLIIFGIGIILGLVGGIYGKVVENVLMTITDIQLSLPLLVIAVILLAVTRPTILTITLVLGVSGWPIYARATRATVVREKAKDYVLAAYIMGAKPIWIIRKYFLLRIIYSTAGYIILEFGLMIIWEALLSFIGIGIQPPNVSLGTIMGDGINYLVTAWWITTLPGIFISVITTCLGFISRKLIKWFSTT